MKIIQSNSAHLKTSMQRFQVPSYKMRNCAFFEKDVHRYAFICLFVSVFAS